MQSPPCEHTGCITFASFNNFAKITPEVIRLWARILAAVPGSRMMIKTRGLQDERLQQAIREQFQTHGIGPERLLILGAIPSQIVHLAQYHQVDISLDTFPYHGTTTTFEALWMGVPVVTLAGDRHASRVGASILSNAGLPELVAGSGDEYCAIAMALANDLPRMQMLRTELRTRIMASPLVDAPGFTRHLEAAYREMYRRLESSRTDAC